jgi:hypothetical protein
MSQSIRHHLLAHCERLRETPSQPARHALLDALEDYARRGCFPQNRARVDRPRPVPVPGGHARRAGEAPVFVDDSGTACAVGHLLRASSHGALAADIARRGRFRYLHEIVDQEPAVTTWAARHGFRLDELARIQPTYAAPPEPIEPAAGIEAHLVVEDSHLESRYPPDQRADHSRRSALLLTRSVQTCVNATGLADPATIWIAPGEVVTGRAPYRWGDEEIAPVRLWGSASAGPVLRCLRLDDPSLAYATMSLTFQVHFELVAVGTPRRGDFALRTRRTPDGSNPPPRPALVRRLASAVPADAAPPAPEFHGGAHQLQLSPSGLRIETETPGALPAYGLRIFTGSVARCAQGVQSADLPITGRLVFEAVAEGYAVEVVGARIAPQLAGCLRGTVSERTVARHIEVPFRIVTEDPTPGEDWVAEGPLDRTDFSPDAAARGVVLPFSRGAPTPD